MQEQSNIKNEPEQQYVDSRQKKRSMETVVDNTNHCRETTNKNITTKTKDPKTLKMSSVI